MNPEIQSMLLLSTNVITIYIKYKLTMQNNTLKIVNTPSSSRSANANKEIDIPGKKFPPRIGTARINAITAIKKPINLSQIDRHRMDRRGCRNFSNQIIAGSILLITLIKNS